MTKPGIVRTHTWRTSVSLGQESRLRRRIGVALIAAACLWQLPLGAECVFFGRETIPVDGALCGKAVDSSGTPLDGEEVLLVTDGGRVVVTTKADAKGRFRFRSVAPGEYRVRVQSFRETGTAFILTASGSRCRHEVRVVFVIGECPSDVSTGAGVRLRVDSSVPAQVIVDGDAEGDAGDFNTGYELIELSPGAHHVEVRAPGHVAQSFDVTIGDYDVVSHRVRLKTLKR